MTVLLPLIIAIAILGFVFWSIGWKATLLVLGVIVAIGLFLIFIGRASEWLTDNANWWR